MTAGQVTAQPGTPAACRVVQQEQRVELHSPFFVFRLDTAAGLRAHSWKNRLNGETLSLGDGPEIGLDIGLPDHPLQTPPLVVSAIEVRHEGDAGEVVFTLAAKTPALSAEVTYRWNAKQPVLRKLATITNRGDRELNRLLNVRLGDYRTSAKTSQHAPLYFNGAALGATIPESERGQGFPLYLNQEFFMSLAHPAGWATGKDGQISLRQYPGARIAPGKDFPCMEAVYGVGARRGAASLCGLPSWPHAAGYPRTRQTVRHLRALRRHAQQ